MHGTKAQHRGIGRGNRDAGDGLFHADLAVAGGVFHQTRRGCNNGGLFLSLFTDKPALQLTDGPVTMSPTFPP